jgi:hypothetical protein
MVDHRAKPGQGIGRGVVSRRRLAAVLAIHTQRRRLYHATLPPTAFFEAAFRAMKRGRQIARPRWRQRSPFGTQKQENFSRLIVMFSPQDFFSTLIRFDPV